MEENVYYLFLIATFGCIFIIIEKATRINYLWLLFILVCPILISYFCLKYWDKTKGILFFFTGFQLVIAIVHMLSGYNYLGNLYNLMYKVFFWQGTVYNLLTN